MPTYLLIFTVECALTLTWKQKELTSSVMPFDPLCILQGSFQRSTVKVKLVNSADSARAAVSIRSQIPLRRSSTSTLSEARISKQARAREFSLTLIYVVALLWQRRLSRSALLQLTYNLRHNYYDHDERLGDAACCSAFFTTSMFQILTRTALC